MFKIKGRFLGTSNATKSGKGRIRKFLFGDVVLVVYASNAKADVLEQSGDCELSIEIQDMVFVK